MLATLLKKFSCSLCHSSFFFVIFPFVMRLSVIIISLPEWLAYNGTFFQLDATTFKLSERYMSLQRMQILNDTINAHVMGSIT